MIKTPWDNPVYPNTTDLGGQLPTSRGTDPSVDLSAGGSGSALTGVPWTGPIVSTPGGEETANSVSGLPAAPSRYQPSETPPAPPDLTDRNPGTIDQR